MKNRFSKWWFLAVIFIPFILMLCLHIGIAIGSYFGININVPNIDASDWFMFASSYLGGSMTLAGVMITLQYERKFNRYQDELSKIGRENEQLGQAISGLNIFVPSAIYQQFCSLPIRDEQYSPTDIASLRQRISEEMAAINKLKLETLFFSNVYSSSAECATCNHPCRVRDICPEFQKLYDKVGSQLFNVLQKMDVYVAICERNAMYRHLANSCRNANKDCQRAGQEQPYSEQEIIGYENKIVDVKSEQGEIVAILKEISQFNLNEVVQLTSLAKEYVAVRQQNANRRCFFEK